LGNFHGVFQEYHTHTRALFGVQYLLAHTEHFTFYYNVYYSIVIHTNPGTTRRKCILIKSKGEKDAESVLVLIFPIIL